VTATLREVYDRLFQAYGHQHWWPGETPFEVMIGAVLVQNTSWRNVEKAIDNLRQQDLLNPRALYQLPPEELAELVRPAGYYRVKAQRLHNLLALFVSRYDGLVELMFQSDASVLRKELLHINGIGPETADSILLYAGGIPTFVVDTYTLRILARHGWIDFHATYDQIKEHFESGLEKDAAFYNEYHALLVRVGHLYCRKTPKCTGCPLAALLPSDGPREPES
jgi:endonuclease-3 related protein